MRLLDHLGRCKKDAEIFSPLQCAQYARLNQWAANTPGPSRKSVDWLRPVFQTFSSGPFAYLERVGSFRSKCSPKYRPSIHVHQACFQSFVSPVVLWLIFIIETSIWERKPRKTHRSAVSRRETEKRRNLTQLWRNGELNELVIRIIKIITDVSNRSFKSQDV